MPALDTIRVVEFGWNWAAPMVGQLFADLGAEVIRIESSTRQDTMRKLPYLHTFFRNMNRGKKSIAVNTKDPEGVTLIKRLVAKSDVVVQNFSAGVMERMGLSYETLQREKPDLIMVSLSAAGQTGPLKNLRGFAIVATGLAGLEGLIGYPDEEPTGAALFGLGDVNMAIQATFATLAALYGRNHTGEGTHIDVSQVECVLTAMPQPLLAYQRTGKLPDIPGNFGEGLLSGIFPTAGDTYTAIVVSDVQEWLALGDVLRLDDWSASPPPHNHLEHLACWQSVAAATHAWSREELVAALQERDIPSAPVLGIDDHFSNAQLISRHLWQQRESLDWEETAILYETPWKMSATQPEIRRDAPALGADTDDVLTCILELEMSDVAALRARGVLQ